MGGKKNDREINSKKHNVTFGKGQFQTDDANKDLSI
jgi:hypothetical protein